MGKPGRPPKIDPRKEFENLAVIDILENPSRNPDGTFNEFREQMEAQAMGQSRIPPNAPPPFLEKLHIDSRVTTLKMVALMRHYHVALEEKKVGQIMAHAGLFAEHGRGYELIPALAALVEYYKRHSEKGKKEGDPTTNRIKTANADIAEAKALEVLGQLVPLDTAKQFWSDARIELRKKVEAAAYLSKEQKGKLLGDFQGLKTELTLDGENE